MDSLVTLLSENWEFLGVLRAGGKTAKPEEALSLGCVMNGMAGALNTVL